MGLDKLLETLSAGLDGKLLQLSWEVQLDGRLDFLRAQCLLLGEDHQLASLLHDLKEKLGKDVVDQVHSLLRDASSRLHLLQHSVDVGLERSRIHHR